jgi:2-amino-4-hydroxy-6-hydroxymethyldihydropteridine diphosphokinase
MLSPVGGCVYFLNKSCTYQKKAVLLQRRMIRIYFGIGSNLGNREKNLQDSLRLLDDRVGKQLACSHIYRSEAQGFESENDFANIVAIYETGYSVEEVLTITQTIEKELGRTQKSVNGIYHDRIIDVDLLKAIEENGNEIQIESETLILPHPRMYERDFVLVPMREVEEINL